MPIKKRIMFLAEYYPPFIMGGGEISLQIIAEGLAKIKNISVYVLTPNYEKYKTKREVKNHVNIIRFKSLKYFLYKNRNISDTVYKKSKSIFFRILNVYTRLSSIGLRMAAKRFEKEIKPDIIHGNNIESILALSKLKTNSVKVSYLRDIRSFSITRTKKKTYRKNDFKGIKKFFTTSNYMKNIYIKETGNNNIKVIFNPITKSNVSTLSRIDSQKKK